MSDKKPLSLEEALRDMPQRSSPPAPQEAKQAMAAAFLKSSEPQVRDAGKWLAEKVAAKT